MSRWFAIVLGLPLFASTVLAQVIPGPAAKTKTAEELLSPATQFYIRWDGIAAHNDAYKKSFWGGIMAGPTGRSIEALLAEWPKLLVNSSLTQPLLQGTPPAELKARMAELKKAKGAIDFILEKGIIVGVEVRSPTPTCEGVGRAFGDLLKGQLPSSDLLTPEVQAYAIVPNVGDRADVLFATFKLLATLTTIKIESFTSAGRSGFRIVNDKEGAGTHIAWWVEGAHFVVAIGADSVDSAVRRVAANTRNGGLRANPLFEACNRDPGYESITRGFVDTARLIALAKNLAGPFVPGLRERLDDLGVGNLQSIVFQSGFSGKESRASYAFNLTGERKGLAAIVKREPFKIVDLPPLPPDTSRFSALRIDPAAVYDSGITALEMLLAHEFEFLGVVEEEAKRPAEKIRLRREYLKREADRRLGVNIAENLLPHLGDKFVIHNSPSEGFSTLGTVVCISVKDAVKLKVALDRISKNLEKMIGPVKMRKKQLCGVEVCELYSQAFVFGAFTPTYAIAGEWLVFALHPQPVQGFVMRLKGELPTWKPDTETVARLAKLPADGCGLQFCDPRATVQNLCSIGPLGINSLVAIFSRSKSEDAYEPFDIGLLPNAHALNKHLFPNLTVTRNTNDAIRIEVSESLSLPLEFIGLEPVMLLGGYFGASIIGI